ncbi:winged helix DNA-binding domain-containing protein [Streptomyces sp. NBC_00988]|uniref:DNA glycosylase AlkZ-like family protein n=1 Tax=Streptomyces sp. NBC_00988 TaxID=2903704 RepID=UPI00386F35E9|nr:winged helix DNA-binding domain-containing protein [Streptomyces sp. NBC_00988]
MTMLDLSLVEARTLAVGAQYLHRSDPVSGGVGSALERLGCVQLDTIQVVRRSHEMILLARHETTPEEPSFLEHHDQPYFFEYWAHAASVIPMGSWPLFAFRRRRFAADGWRGPAVDAATVDQVRQQVKDSGPVTVTDLGGARGSGWERSSPHKWAAEWLLATGEFVCVRRRRFSRVYQTAESAVPGELLAREPSDQECFPALTGIALRALGVATAEDVADYFRLPKNVVADTLADHPEAVPVRVEGWPDVTWGHASVLGQPPLVRQDAVTPLSPFDSLIWHRPRMRRLFGVEYLLEAYKKSALRECGYFGMPVLAGTEITGRLALRVRDGVAEVEGHQLRDGADPAHHTRAAATAAAWAAARPPAQPLPWLSTPPVTGGAS